MRFLILIFTLLAPATSSAAIIYSGLQDITITTGSFDGVYLDVENLNPLTNHATTAISGWDVNFFFGGIGEYNQANFQPVRTSPSDSFSPILNLSYGTLVSSYSVFATGIGGSDTDHVGTGLGQFQPGVPGYLGFSLAGTGGPMYGWMRLTLTQDAPGAKIHDWAYDVSGSSILVGQIVIPEPGKSLLILLGIFVLITKRRRVN
jgi:hypothetical protein